MIKIIRFISLTLMIEDMVLFALEFNFLAVVQLDTILYRDSLDSFVFSFVFNVSYMWLLIIYINIRIIVL